MCASQQHESDACPDSKNESFLQGNCTEQPSRRGLGIEGATLLGMKHAQCMLVTDARVMIAVDSLWLDGVYIRLKRRNMDTPLSFITAESTMWMTHVSIQGDGFGSTGSAFIAKYGSFYAECTSPSLHPG